MAHCLNDSLRLVAPYVPAALVPPTILKQVEAIARKLPPIHCGGFECRMDDDARVDFQQRVLNRHEELLVLHHHIDSSDLSQYEPWRRLANLCEELLDPNRFLARALSAFWLEFDLQGPHPRPTAPSVFLTLQDNGFGASHVDEVLRLVDEAMRRLLPRSAPKRIGANVRRIVLALPQKTRVHHLGIMMARDLEALRLVIREFSPSAVIELLRELAWEGPLQRLEQQLHALPELVDRLVLSLDVGSRIGGSIGLEFFPGMHPDLEPRWSALLDHLVTSRLCAPGKAHALLSWPGHSEPTSSELAWPAHLLFDSLLEPPHQFTAVGRRLSHIKMVTGCRIPMAVKAYFGFGPLRLEYPPRTSTPSGVVHHQTTSRPEASPLPSDELTSAIERGLSYLLDARDDAGWWREFVVQGGSDEWTTAYVGAQLAEPGERWKASRQAARRAWELLATREHASGGWGFNALSPKDADSTSWALRLAHSLGKAESPRAQKARAFVLQHIQPDGGVATFIESTRLRLLSRSPPGAPVDGWCSAHPDVTAVAADIEGVGEKARRYLRATQRADGSWSGYWIDDGEYATAFAVEALAASALREDERRIERALSWAVKRLGSGGFVHSRAHGGASAFATALALRILLTASRISPSLEADMTVRDSLRHGVRWLLEAQRPDGSWLPSFQFRHPPVDVLYPEQEGYRCINLDAGSTFTTATVLLTLARAHSLGVSPRGERV